MKRAVAIFMLILFAFGTSAYQKKACLPAGREVGRMGDQNISIKSPAFKNMEHLPVKYSRNGKGINPPLIFEKVPATAKSLALIMDDPDAPSGTFDHWLVFNIPPKTKEIKENSVPEGAVSGKNSAGNTRYVSPSPPPGKPHRYIFKLYALDAMLQLNEGAYKSQVEKAMEGHVISQAALTGLYKR